MFNNTGQMTPLLTRASLTSRVDTALGRSPCVALLGPRQCGKTTLARQISGKQPGEYLDLEDPAIEARLANPKMVLERLSGLVIIDEIQRRPDLFRLLRVLIDREPAPARFLLLGSASPDIARGASETLAGRIEFVAMGGFSLEETGFPAMRTLWLRGGFPRSYLAASDEDSHAWRRDFVRTFLERDLGSLGFHLAPEAMRRFLTMIAHQHGNVWNSSRIASSLGLTHTTSRRHLDLLTGAFLVRQLAPWHANTGKRLVKSPKVYLRDPGILHELLGIRAHADLESHPVYGSSWEGFAIEEILGRAGDRDAYFYGTYAGAELDLLIADGDRRLGFELKVTDAPRPTKSMWTTKGDLGLDHLYVVHPGDRSYPLEDWITALALRDLDSVPFRST
jgi:uncharacterized protein